MILGKVQARDNTNGLQIIIDGEDEPTTKKYHYLASYVPSAGDRILIEEIGDSYVVLGKVIDNFSNSGKARTADSATSANKTTYIENGYSGYGDIRFESRYGEIYIRVGNSRYQLATK